MGKRLSVVFLGLRRNVIYFDAGITYDAFQETSRIQGICWVLAVKRGWK